MFNQQQAQREIREELEMMHSEARVSGRESTRNICGVEVTAHWSTDAAPGGDWRRKGYVWFEVAGHGRMGLARVRDHLLDMKRARLIDSLIKAQSDHGDVVMVSRSFRSLNVVSQSAAMVRALHLDPTRFTLAYSLFNQNTNEYIERSTLELTSESEIEYARIEIKRAFY